MMLGASMDSAVPLRLFIEVSSPVGPIRGTVPDLSCRRHALIIPRSIQLLHSTTADRKRSQAKSIESAMK